MNANITDKEILGQERKYWDAMRTNDVDTAVALTKFPCVIAGPQGARTVSEKEYRAMMSKAEGAKFAGIEIEKPEVQFLNDDAAVLTYTTQVNGMTMLDVSTWIRENSKWVCAFHSEHPIQASRDAKN